MRDKADCCGTCEDTEVAHRTHGRNRRADRHNVLFPHEREKDRNNIRRPNTDRKEPRIEERIDRREHDEQDPGAGEQRAAHSDRTLSKPLHDGISKETHEEHRRGEHREPHAREREIIAPHRRQIDTAPVHHSALAEECDERRDADEYDDAARHSD